MMDEIKTEHVYSLVIDIIDSTKRLLSDTTAVRDSFNIALTKVLSPFVENLYLEDAITKFVGDGWIISTSDSGKLINLIYLAILLKYKFNSEIERHTEISFAKRWDLRLGIASGNDIRVSMKNYDDFVGDSVRRATRISTLCHPNEILTDPAIYCDTYREFESNLINKDERMKELGIEKCEDDIPFIYSIQKPKGSKLKNPDIMLYLFDQLEIETEKELIIQEVKDSASKQDLPIEEKERIDRASVYLSTIGRNTDSEIIDEELKKTGYKRSIVNWNKKINMLSDYESAKSVLEEMKKADTQPDVVTFNTLMNKVKTIESAKSVLEEMKKADIQPNVVTFNTLMNKVKTIESAKSVLEEMKKADIQPNVVTFNTLMNKVDTFDSAKSVLEEMKKADIQPNVVTFNTLMNKVDTFDSAKSVLEEMKKADIQPNVVTFNTLMNKVDTFDSAKSVLEEMKKADIQPNVVTFNTLMNKVDTFDSAKSVLEEMKKADIQPTLLSYCTLFSKDIDFDKYPVEDIHKWYSGEKNHPSSALEPLIKNLFDKKRYGDAYFLILNYPHLESARKIVIENFRLSLSMYNSLKRKVYYENNIDYALGIAYYDMGRLTKSRKYLESALSRATAVERKEHIQILLKEIKFKSQQGT